VTSESAATGIDRDQLSRYLARVLGGRVEVLDARPLKAEVGSADDPKGFGYGVPFEVECVIDGLTRSLVVSRTRPAKGFGHDYPAASSAPRRRRTWCSDEASLSPELALHTDHDFSVNVDAFLRLAERLQRAATAEGYAPRPVA